MCIACVNRLFHFGISRNASKIMAVPRLDSTRDVADCYWLLHDTDHCPANYVRHLSSDTFCSWNSYKASLNVERESPIGTDCDEAAVPFSSPRPYPNQPRFIDQTLKKKREESHYHYCLYTPGIRHKSHRRHSDLSLLKKIFSQSALPLEHQSRHHPSKSGRSFSSPPLHSPYSWSEDPHNITGRVNCLSLLLG